MYPTSKTSLLLRLPIKEHRELKAEAFRRGVSLNYLCNEKLSGNSFRETGGPPKDSSITKILDHFGSFLFGVVLFGSTARGEQTKKSDKDLLLVLRPEVVLDRSWYRRFDSLNLDPRITPQFVRMPVDSHEVGSIWFEAAIDGIILHDTLGAIAKTFRDLRKQMAENRIQRLWAHGHPYWVRKDSNEKSILGR